VSRPSHASARSTDFNLAEAIRRLRRVVARWRQPVVERVANEKPDPFRILIATMLSLRTKDETTDEAARRLFAVASTPEAMARLPEKRLARLIYPVGFYNQKACCLRAACSLLLERFGGRVPADIDALVTLPGVGRKVANLVVTRAFHLPGICVDTHVHRISNRWGFIETKTPDESERVLRERLPRRYWMEYNGLLVAFGQNCCTPLSPHCSTCPLNDLCPRRGVARSR